MSQSLYLCTKLLEFFPKLSVLASQLGSFGPVLVHEFLVCGQGSGKGVKPGVLLLSHGDDVVVLELFRVRDERRKLINGYAFTLY